CSAHHRDLPPFPTRRSSDLLVFSYMNLARAFHELEGGAELFCLHKNRWWQTKHGPALDAGAFSAASKYAVDGLPSTVASSWVARSEEHTSELQSRRDLVCRL